MDMTDGGYAAGNGGDYYMTTVAGNGNISKSGENIPATTADLYYPTDVATDRRIVWEASLSRSPIIIVFVK
ncbi:hypothetical protein [Cohnella sp. WQ 127256]|uniref:hypothetical protein n=1 Tax=Cohnella sp. WQ 127256 TaxID=2938790 RepID=UPI002118FFB3|nr:hypothetical protein [Cohnella sp. WQ 127256]